MISEAFNMDCLEGMKNYPDKYFELAIVDPPYGIKQDIKQNTLNPNRLHYNGSGGGRFKTYHITNWDSSPPSIDYFTELKRVSKNQIIWGGNYFHNVHLSGVIVWDKGESVFDNDGEMAKTSFGGFRIFRMCRADAYINNQENKIHPTQKPTKLYKWLLQKYATCKKCNNTGIIYENIGEKWMGSSAVDCEYCDVSENGVPKILDTHLGSGSSRIAAYSMGFDFTGYEIDKEYFDKQERRFNDFKMQLTIF